MRRPVSHLLAAALVTAAATTALQAQTRSWDLGATGWGSTGTPSSGACSTASSARGNVVNCAATGGTGTSLAMRGFASAVGTTPGFTPGAITAARVVSHGTYGVGICNVWEASTCTSPNHAVDDIPPGSDFLLLAFDRSVALNSLTFGWTGKSATNVRVYSWNGAGDALAALAAPGQTVGGVLGTSGTTFGLVSSFGLSGLATPSNRLTNSTFNPANVSSQYWIVSPNGGDAVADAFKLRGLSAGHSPVAASVVPEPSTYALMGAGLAALLGAARRRRAA